MQLPLPTQCDGPLFEAMKQKISAPKSHNPQVPAAPTPKTKTKTGARSRTTKTKTKIPALLVVAAVAVAPAAAFPSRVSCGQRVAVGEVLMANLPALEETTLTFASVVLSRGDTPVPCGGAYVPGETLTADLVADAGTQWLFDLEGNGTFAGGSCGGRRADGAAQLVAPLEGPVTIRAGFAKAYGAVTVTAACTLEASDVPAPSRAPTAAGGATAPPTTPNYYETDVLVVGAGLAGSVAAWAAKAADPDATVTVVTASLTDVTTAYSGGWLWLPNNILQADGADPEDAFVEHASQIAYPAGGAPAWADAGLRSFWEFSPAAMTALRDAHVFNWSLQYDMTGQPFPDYYGADAYPNNTLPRGRVIRATKGGLPLAGYELVAELQDAALSDVVLEGYLVDAVEERGDGSTVVTARAKDPANSDVVITAARGVVVATGGKIRGLEPDADDDATLDGNYGLDAHVVGTCASPDSRGDALDAVATLPGVRIANKGNSWMFEVDSTGLNTIWFLWYGQPGGDFFVVDGTGKRVYNEGLSYNARGEFHLDRVVDNDGESSVEDDAARSQLFLVYGDAAKATYSYLIDSADTIATNVSRAGDAIAGAPWFSLGALADDFGANLRDTLDAFNAAASGDGDDPFERGVPGTTAYESSIAWWQFAFAYLGAAAPETIGYGGNALTQPFAGDGASTRLYVRPLNFGSIDTKFGPECDGDMRVAGTANVYAAGNAAASPFGQTYTAPGNTLGFALTSGWVAGRRAVVDVTRPPTPEFVVAWAGEPLAIPPGAHALPASLEHQVLQLAYANSTTVVAARSYGGFPWEGVGPLPLAVSCDGDGLCDADFPEGLWLLGFDAAPESDRAAASRLLGQATFGATTAGVDDVVEVFGNDTAAWLDEQMALPPTSHRAYFRRRALPAFAGACDASEAATDPALGNPRYGWYYGADDRGRGVAFHDDLEFPHDEELGKGMVFTNIALHAPDQLRQRVAWSLSQVYVVGVGGVEEARDEVEVWLKFYDIFVEHAFGNLRDVLRAISFSPVMAVYLTYLGSRQFDGVDQYPDENYAREFMQLFTIGLRELRDDQRRATGVFFRVNFA